MYDENHVDPLFEEFIGAIILGVGYGNNRVCIKVEKPNKEIKMITLTSCIPKQLPFIDLKIERMEPNNEIK